MSQSNRHTFLTTITVIFISFVFPLTLTHNSRAEKQPDQEFHIIENQNFNSDNDLDQYNILVAIRESKKPLQSLTQILKILVNDKDDIVARRNAFQVLGTNGIKWGDIIEQKDSGDKVKKTVDILLKSLDKEQEKDLLIRRYAANDITAISTIEKFKVDSNVVNSLTKALKNDPYSPVKRNTADALKAITEKHMGDLTIKDNKYRYQIRDALIYTLQIPDKNQNPDYIYARRAAAYTFGSLAIADENSIKALLRALKDTDLGVRSNVAYALGELLFQKPRKDVLTDLVEALAHENNYDSQMLRNTIDSINKVADITLKPEKIPTFSKEDLVFYQRKLEDAKLNFDTALNSGKLSKNKREHDNLTEIRDGKINGINKNIKIIQEALDKDNFLSKFLKEYPYVAWSFICALLGVVGYLGIYFTNPLKLLEWDEFFQSMSTSISIRGITIPISLRWIIKLKYSDRVLDSFVKAYLPTVREEFERLPTVSDRQTHISIPVVFGKNTIIKDLSSKDLQDGFKRNEPLLIWGESGSGKTNLACHIAQWAMSDTQDKRLCQHPMLPVIIEGELNCQQEDPFTSAIWGQLKRLMSINREFLSKDLLKKLLVRQRVLVIVDRFSEMSEETRQNIRPEAESFIVNALIITSRKSPMEELSNISKITIETSRLEYDTLSVFMGDYLREKGRFNWFTNDEFQTACQRLTKMVGEGKNITPMLATLFIDQLIEAKEKAKQSIRPQLPDNVPYLMMKYLEQVNNKVPDAQRVDLCVLQKVTSTLAWEYLNTDYHPKPLPKEEARKIISMHAQDEPLTLDYLVNNLNLIQPVGVKDRFKFALDPMAEYLAAYYLLCRNGSDVTKWSEFFEQESISNIPESFLIAIQEWYLVEGQEYQVPDSVSQKLDALKNRGSTELSGEDMNTKIPEILVSR